VEFVRHEVMLDRKDDSGTLRAHLEEKARRGDARALEQLEGPEPPWDLMYLADWAYSLCGRSGVSMDGLAPLSYGTIKAWAELMGTDPSPLEVQALIQLDAVIRKPEPLEEEEQEGTLDEPGTHAWPEKKSG